MLMPIMIPWAFKPVPYKPRHHFIHLSAARHAFARKNRRLTGNPAIICLGNAEGGEKLSEGFSASLSSLFWITALIAVCYILNKGRKASV